MFDATQIGFIVGWGLSNCLILCYTFMSLPKELNIYLLISVDNGDDFFEYMLFCVMVTETLPGDYELT